MVCGLVPTAKQTISKYSKAGEVGVTIDFVCHPLLSHSRFVGKEMAT